MGSLREKMLEDDHNRELQNLQCRTQNAVMSFTETIACGNRIITRTAEVTILANADLEESMAFLKRSVRDPTP